MWTDVAARGGNVRRPPPGGMGSSERQGTLAGGGGRQGRKAEDQLPLPSPAVSSGPRLFLPKLVLAAHPLHAHCARPRGRVKEGQPKAAAGEVQ